MKVNTTSTSSVWRGLQYFSVVSAVALIIVLLVRPRLGLFIAWDVLIPLVPIMLLVAPMLWRNVCPIAVVGQFFERFGLSRRRKLPRWLQRVAPTISIFLLFALVPLRLVLFNLDATSLALLMVVTVVVSLVGGAIITGKAAWCATFCPVLPVERLYGQRALVNLPHAHCETCSGCTRACFDLIPSRSLSVLADSHNKSHNKKSPLRPMSLFAVAFPGFVLGYYTTPAGISIFLIYLWILMMSVIPAVTFTIIQRMFSLERTTLHRICAALAISIYYWFTIPAIALAVVETFGTNAGSVWLINSVRGVLLVVAAIWLAAGLRNRAAIAV